MAQTRTDHILEAVAKELEARRPEIEQDNSLRSVSIIVMLSERTGKPCRIFYRSEGQRDIGPHNR